MADAPETDASSLAAARWSKLYGDGGEQFAALIGLMRAHQLIVLRVDAVLKQADLSRNAFLVLLSLRMTDGGALSLGRLGRRLLVHPTTITTVVDQLEQAGFVERSPHPTDRRTVLATITPAGQDAIGAASLALRDAGFGFEDASPQQIAALTREVFSITAMHDIDEQGSTRS